MQTDVSKILEAAYLKEIRKILAPAQDLIERLLIPELSQIVREEGIVRDSLTVDQDTRILSKLIETVRIRYGQIISDTDLENAARRAFESVRSTGGLKFSRQMKQVAGIDILADPELSRLFASFVQDSLKDIKSIPARLFDEVEGVLRRSVRAGRRAADIVPEIQKRFGVFGSRAALIARDQLNKINGQIVQRRQTDLGIEEYKWRTSMDERVRPAHADREGDTFRWDDPPEGGHPGEPIQCRCTAEPILPKL